MRGKHKSIGVTKFLRRLRTRNQTAKFCCNDQIPFIRFITSLISLSPGNLWILLLILDLTTHVISRLTEFPHLVPMFSYTNGDIVCVCTCVRKRDVEFDATRESSLEVQSVRPIDALSRRERASRRGDSCVRVVGMRLGNNSDGDNTAPAREEGCLSRRLVVACMRRRKCGGVRYKTSSSTSTTHGAHRTATLYHDALVVETIPRYSRNSKTPTTRVLLSA